MSDTKAGRRCPHPIAHQRITDVARMDGTIGEERWCSLCDHTFGRARANRKVLTAPPPEAELRDCWNIACGAHPSTGHRAPAALPVSPADPEEAPNE